YYFGPLEHGKSVSSLLKGIDTSGYGVGFFRINSLAADPYILHPPGFPVVYRLEEIHAVSHYRTFLHMKVNLIGQAGHLQEAAVLLRIVPGSVLQSVQNLLARGLDDAHGVVPGIYIHQILSGYLTGSDGIPDAAAVDQGDIRSGNGPVSVRHKVSHVGLSAAD